MNYYNIKSNKTGKVGIYNVVKRINGFVMYRNLDNALFVRSSSDFNARAAQAHPTEFPPLPTGIKSTYGRHYEVLVKTVNGWRPGFVTYNERLNQWSVDTFDGAEFKP